MIIKSIRIICSQNDAVEQLNQMAALLVAKVGGHPVLMDFIDRPELAHQDLTLVGQIQGVGALIVGGGLALGEASAFKVVEQGNEIRALDPERRTDLRLLEARVAFDDGQHPILDRPDV